MTLSPDEIESMEFVVGLRGYDQEAVHAFLKKVAADYREVTNALAEAQAVARADTQPIEALGARVERIIKVATEEAQAIMAAAERDAAEVRREAERLLEQTRPRRPWLWR